MSTETYSQFMKEKRGSEYLEFIDHIIEFTDLPKGAKILEIGPGPGWIGIWLISKRRADLNVDGVEPSSDMRNTAKINAISEGVDGKINYFPGFVENLDDFKNNSYDLVISNDSLHHWVDPKKAFQEISRVLKPNGRLYVQDERRDLNFGGKIIVNVFGRIFAGKMWKFWKSSIDASYTKDEITDILKMIPDRSWVVKTHILGLSIEC